MKRISVIASILLCTNLFGFSSINIDVDLGGINNVIEQYNNNYYKAFFDDNGIMRKADVRLRGAKNASISSGKTSAGIATIYNLIRGSIVPKEDALEDSGSVNPVNLVSTTSSVAEFKSFHPGIQIYSSNGIQIKRGYFFSQEFLKFFDLNSLFVAVEDYSYNPDIMTEEDKQKSVIFLLLLDKFNIRSFTMFYNDMIDNKYNAIIAGLNGLRDLVDAQIRRTNYKQIFEDKINTIETLLKVARTLYQKASNQSLSIPQYDIDGFNKYKELSAVSLPLNKAVYIDFINTQPKEVTNTLNHSLLPSTTQTKQYYSVDRTHIYKEAECPENTYFYFGGNILLYDSDKGRYRVATEEEKQAILDGNYQDNGKCYYYIDVDKTRAIVKAGLEKLGTYYNSSINQILRNTSSALISGSDERGLFNYLTNNIKELTRIMLNFTQSYAVRDVNAIYRAGDKINMLDFMDDIQEVIALKQFKFDKDLGTLRKYEVAVSLSSFANNNVQSVSINSLQTNLSNAVQQQEMTDDGPASSVTSTATGTSTSMSSNLYVSVTDNGGSASADSVAPFLGDNINNLSDLSQGSSTDGAVAPSKVLLFTLNVFDKGGKPIVASQSPNLINGFLNANYDSTAILGIDVFAWGSDDNNAYHIGDASFTNDERYNYLINSFALFGEACTDAGDSQVCTLADRHVDNPDEWINLGTNNVQTLYDLSLDAVGKLSNVVIDKSKVEAKLVELDTVLVDKNTGVSINTIKQALMGPQSEGEQPASLPVDVFMPFKANGILTQTHYELRHYVPDPIYTTVCSTNENGEEECYDVITGYTWKLSGTDYPNYSCRAAVQLKSKVATAILAKTYPAYLSGEIDVSTVGLAAVGITDGVDAKDIAGQEIYTGEEIGLDYGKIANPNITNQIVGAATCLAHGKDADCTYEDVGYVINCQDLGNDDFYKAHAVIQFLQGIDIANYDMTSDLIYKYDYQALDDETKAQIVNPVAATLYSFDEKMPDIGTQGFDDTTNVYKMIFLDGHWKDTVIDQTSIVDSGNVNTAGVVVYDCNGVLQTTMCTDDELPSVEGGNTENNTESLSTE